MGEPLHAHWLLAEFDSPEAIVRAARALHEQGYRRLEAFTPYPIVDLEEALAIPRSKIPRLVFAAGACGAMVGYGVQLWLNAYDYPLNVGGRPLHSAPSMIPITFETTVLFAVLATFFGFFFFARLPRLSHPVLDVPGFERAGVDRFWLAIEQADAHFDPARSRVQLEELGAGRLVEAEGEP